MDSYLFSLGGGVLIGIVYSLLKVRSPAPPLVALIGLLGMLIGAQALPVAKQWLSETAVSRQASRIEHFSGARAGIEESRT